MTELQDRTTGRGRWHGGNAEPNACLRKGTGKHGKSPTVLKVNRFLNDLRGSRRAGPRGSPGQPARQFARTGGKRRARPTPGAARPAPPAQARALLTPPARGRLGPFLSALSGLAFSTPPALVLGMFFPRSNGGRSAPEPCPALPPAVIARPPRPAPCLKGWMRQGEPRRPSPFPASCAHRAGEESRRPRLPAPPRRSFRAAEMPRAARAQPRRAPAPLRSCPLRPAHLWPWRRRRPPRAPEPPRRAAPTVPAESPAPPTAPQGDAALPVATPLVEPPANHGAQAFDWQQPP